MSFAPSRRAFSASEHGATLVEGTFALTFILLFFLVSIDILRTGFDLLSVEYVTEFGMRRAVLPGETATNVVDSIIRLSRTLGVELDPLETGQSPYIELCPVDRRPCPGSVNANLGGSGDLLALRIEVPTSSLLFGGSGILRRVGISIHAESQGYREFP